MSEGYWKTIDESGSQNCACIGTGVTIKGSISAGDTVVVHGTVDGDVSCHKLLVSPSGTIRGNVAVDQADVQGTILERISARVHLFLRETGRIEGVVSYRDIEIKKGGMLTGEISAIKEPQTYAETANNVINSKYFVQQTHSPPAPFDEASTG